MKWNGPVDRPAAAQDRLDPPGRLRGLEGSGDEPIDAGVFLEIGVDERGGLGLGDPQPARPGRSGLSP